MMKRIIYICMLMVTVVALGSCNKYLDVKPEGKVLLTTYSDYNKLLNYNTLHLFSDNEVKYLTDYMWINEIAIIGRDPSLVSISFLFDESKSRFPFLSTGLYNQCYTAIARYSLILENLGSATGGTPGQYKRLLAEARVLRAYAHFILVNTYAKTYNPATAATDRGICIKNSFNLEELTSQSTVEEVYAYIEKELKMAVDDLGLQSDNAFHPTRAFGYALLAKMYLFKGAFSLAKEAAQKSLDANNYIFDLVKYYQAGQTELVDMGMAENTYYAMGGTSLYTPQNYIVSTGMYNSFGASDTRRLVFFSTTSSVVQAGSNTAAFIKVPNGASRFAYNTMGIKTTEVYLMLAECLAREGNITGALEQVDKVRAKRILPAGYTASTAATAQDAVKLVIEERKKELLFGYNRFWDQRRLSIEPEYAITVERKFPVVNTTVPQVTYTLKPNSFLYVIPFDKTVILNNPNIKQNTNDVMDL